jgi:predicted Holliday junction resolvase-like endonuclease
MKSEALFYFRIQRQIFGVCPCCGELFRLSECQVYARSRPGRDWLDALIARDESLNRVEERIEGKAAEVREQAREKGRRLARSLVRRIDPVFAPLGLRAEDAKVLFHPVDYVVYEGLSGSAGVKRVGFLDRRAQSREHQRIQESIEDTIEAGRVDWHTIRIGQDGIAKFE